MKSLINYITENFNAADAEQYVKSRYIWSPKGCRNWFDSAEDYKLFFRGELQTADSKTNDKGKEYAEYLFNNDYSEMEDFIDRIFDTHEVKNEYMAKCPESKPFKTNENLPHTAYVSVAPFIFGDNPREINHRKVKRTYRPGGEVWNIIDCFGARKKFRKCRFKSGNGSIKMPAAFAFEGQIKGALENFIKLKQEPACDDSNFINSLNYKYALSIFNNIPKYMGKLPAGDIIDELIDANPEIKIPDVKTRTMIKFDKETQRIMANFTDNTGEELADVRIYWRKKNINISLKDTKEGGYTLCNIGVKKLLGLSQAESCVTLNKISGKIKVNENFERLLYSLGFDKKLTYDAFNAPTEPIMSSSPGNPEYEANIKNLIMGALGKDYILLESYNKDVSSKIAGESVVIPSDEKAIIRSFDNLKITNINWQYPALTRRKFKIIFQTNLFGPAKFGIEIRSKHGMVDDVKTLGFGEKITPAILVYLNRNWQWEKLFNK